MISIASDMDEFDVAQEIRFERQLHKGSFLLLEGEEDLKRFTRFTDDKLCSTVNCFGRKNLIGAIEILYDEGFAGALGLADADFDRITGSLRTHEGIIYSDAHDFDMDWVCEGTLRRYIDEVGDKDKCDAAGGLAGVVEHVFIATRPLSILRYLNEYQNLRYSLQRIRHDEISADSKIDVDLLVPHVSQGAFSSATKQDWLKTLIKNHLSAKHEAKQLTNGHDFCAALGLALRDKFGKRVPPQTWRSEVQIHFRLAYSEEDFARSDVFKQILQWQKDNPPFVILKASLLALAPVVN